MKKLSTRKSVVLVLFLELLLVPPLTFAQQDTGAIVGTVFDPGGAVVPGATVRVTNTGTNISVSVTTDSSGAFNTPPLRIGIYRMEVEVSGFKKSVRDGISLRVQDRLNLDVRLEVGEVTQTVDVSATEVLLQTQTSSVGQIMETHTIVDLPLNGRNYLQLITLTAGAFVPQPMNTIWADQFVAINGNRAMLNSFLLDGVNNNTTDNSNPAIIPPPEAIAEFKVQTNAMAAEFGRSAGGAINVSIKSGTNQYHGNVFEFIRNDKLDANNFFNSGRAKPPLRQNQFGFTIGGPIAKDRTFFFGDFQGTRLRRGRTEVRTVPNPDERLGDFSKSGITIFDPQTSRPNPNGTGVIRDPFTGNVIPDNRISPAARKVIALYPLPNVAGARTNNFIGNSKLSSDTDQFDVRVDHQFSPNDSAFARVSVSEADHINPGSLETVASGTFRFPSNGSTPGRGAALGYTHTFSPTLINEVRGGFARLAWFGQVFDPSVRGSEQLGIPGIPKTDQTFGLPLFNITGVETLGDQGLLPVVRGKNTFNYLDNLTYIRGKHSFKAGVDTRFTQFNINQPGGPRGNFTFNGVFTRQPASPSGTGSGIADLLLGYADAASLSNSVTIGVRIRSYSGFFMDDWKVNQKLTLNVGLRYDLVTPPVEVKDRQLAFDLQRGQLVFAKPGSYRDRAFTDLDKNNFAPRFGFAYQATPSTVVRGGYGIFWAFEDNGTFNPAFNYPYRFTVSYPSDQVNTSSAIRLDTGFPSNALTEFIPQFASYGSRDFNLRPAYVQQWNITLERQVHSILFGASYVGNKGTNLARLLQVNQPVPGSGGVNSRRPYLGFGSITNVESSGNSIYHGLLLKAEKRFTRGLSFLGSYTYSKAIEDSGSPALDNIPTAGPDTPQDPRNLRLERGLSPHDVRQRFVFSGVYELPFGRGKSFMNDAHSVAEALLGGWQVNGVSTLQTGRHFTFGNSIDQSNTGSSNVRANVDRDPRLPKSQRTIQRFFDTSAISVPAQFTYGNAGRNTGEGPGQVNLDLSLFKNFFFNRDTSGHFRPNELQFRVEAFNITNTPQFQNPNRIKGTSQFGSITDLVNTSRQIQFALKFFF
jgi:Carboxypeptidase regulatory-like domain/TonB dependent receptor-like, beta-barrel